jgi:hypothetical protein
VDLGALPPYRPDGTLPAVPEVPVDGEHLRRRYRLSKAAFHNRKNALPSVKGIKQGKRVLFTPDEVYTFDALDWYLDQGFTLDEVAGAQQGFDAAVPPDDNEEETTIQKTSQSTPNDLNLSPQAFQGLKFLAQEIVKDTLKQLPRAEMDPLKTLRLLDEASDKEYVLTTKMLADVLGFNDKTVHAFKSPQYRHGFELTKLGPGKWTVKRLKANKR